MFPTWKLYVDCSSNINGSGVGIILVNPKEKILEYKAHFKSPTINNITEHVALLARLLLVGALDAYSIKAHSDSQLVVS
jgi:ribonuclease HI